MMDLDARLARGPLRVRSVWSAGSPERLARRVLQRRRFLFAVDAIALCGCLALAILLSGQRSLRGPWSASASGAIAAGMTAFSDGSVAEASSRDTELHIEEETATRVVTRLAGGARFHVVPNRERTFEVRAGDVRVRVLGTVFSVQQLSSGQTQVLVERGRVEVAWLGGATLLESGQGGTFPPTPGSEGEPEPPAALAIPAQPPSPAPRARDAARDEAADLMLAADVARISGHPEDAVRSLRAVCDRHSSDRRAPVAAFTLGRVLLDDLGRSAEAAAAFQRARVLWPAGPLAEDALAREADAWHRAGREDAARGPAGDYLGRYPHGRHAAAMRKILGQ